MECASCNHQNRDGRRFCSQCGAELSTPCSNCRFINDPGDRFCGGCGQELASAAPTPAPAVNGVAGGSRDDAERRPLTILFADLVGSTEMSLRLDAEDLRDVTLRFQRESARLIERYNGFVARYMGDGILAYFGYPRAHEDDAERALLAGGDIVTAIETLNAEAKLTQQFELGVRVGVASGLAVVGDLIGEGASQERAVIGETPNLAARMQTLAEPNTVVLDDATCRLAGSAFALTDLGLKQVKGVPAPVRAWRVDGRRGSRERFESATTAAAHTLVGRDEELDQMRAIWKRAQAGEGQAITLAGEAGIGKTRLAQALYDEAALPGAQRVRYQCLPLYANSAFFPFVEHLSAGAGMAAVDPPGVRFEKLRSYLARFAQDTNTYRALFGKLLSIPAADHYTELNMSASEMKSRMISAFCEQILLLSEQAGVMVLFEDMHWADPSSLELLGALIERLPGKPVLLLCTHRPDTAPEWQHLAQVTRLELTRLNDAHSEALITQRLAGTNASPRLVRELLDRCDGIPLFVEELTQSLHRAPTRGAGDTMAIPDTLQSSLMARLDKLQSARQVVQTGAAIGRAFWYALLAAVSDFVHTELDAALESLTRERLLEREGIPPNVRYSFRQGLLRDAAYQSLLRSRRQEIHARIARALEEDFQHYWRANPEILAHHLTEAGQLDSAIDYWRAAADRALEASANIEAERHFSRAVELVRQLPESSSRNQRELNLLTSMGAVLINNHGAGSSLVADLYRHCFALCEQIGQGNESERPAEHFATLWGLWRTCESLNVAMGLVDQMRTLGEQEQRPDLIMQAHHSGWATLFNLGRLTECLDSIAIGNELYDAEAHADHSALYGGHDPQVCAHGIGAVALCLQGQPARGAKLIEEAVTLARTLGPGSLAHALDFAATFERVCDNPAGTLEHAKELLTCSLEHEFADYEIRARAYHGWAIARLGEEEAGLEELRASILAQRTTGTSEDFSFFLDMLADVHALLGRPHDGLVAIEEAMHDSLRNEAAFWSSATKRCEAVLMGLSDDVPGEQIVERYEQAITIAREQQAPLLELDAALELVKYLQRAGQEVDVRQLLEKPYGNIETGRELRVLTEARELLSHAE